MARLRSTIIKDILPGLLFLTLLGCKKDTEYIISGRLIDPNQSINIEGASVEVWVQRIMSGIFEADYKLAGEQKTGSNGSFQIKLESGNYTGVKMIFSKKGYFGWETQLNLETLKNNNGLNAYYQMVPKTFLKIHVFNQVPLDASDYFDFRLLNAYTNCEECCKGQDYEFSGMDVNQTLQCLSSGNTELILQWTRRKNKEQVVKTESIFTKAFDTTKIEFIY